MRRTLGLFADVAGALAVFAGTGAIVCVVVALFAVLGFESRPHFIAILACLVGVVPSIAGGVAAVSATTLDGEVRPVAVVSLGFGLLSFLLLACGIATVRQIVHTYGEYGVVLFAASGCAGASGLAAIVVVRTYGRQTGVLVVIGGTGAIICAAATVLAVLGQKDHVANLVGFAGVVASIVGGGAAVFTTMSGGKLRPVAVISLVLGLLSFLAVCYGSRTVRWIIESFGARGVVLFAIAGCVGLSGLAAIVAVVTRKTAVQDIEFAPEQSGDTKGDDAQ